MHKVNIQHLFMETRNDTAIGGLIGGMMGILGGPLGMPFGGSIGALTGSAIDTSDAIHNASLIEKVTEQLFDGEIVLIALEQETEDGTVQIMLSKFDVSIIEEDAAEVAEEVERAPGGDKVKTLPICEFFENLIKPIAFGSRIAYYISELGRNSLRPSLMKKPSVRRR